MAEKEIKTRIIHKHDVEANWKKAVGFIPKNAELIVYDADENNLSPRVKIGDGIKNVNDLNFFSGMSNWDASEGEAGYVANRTHWKEQVLVEYNPESTNNEEYTIDDEYYWIKVSNYVPTVEELIGKTVTVHFSNDEGGEDIEHVIVAEDIQNGLDSDVYGLVISFEFDGQPCSFFVIPSTYYDVFLCTNITPGVYFESYANFYYIKNLSGLTTAKYHKIKEEYLHTPNWEASIGEPGYIENRTHYKDYKPILPLTEVVWEEAGGHLELNTNFSLIAGKKYKVTWGNIDYITECFDYSEGADTGPELALGDPNWGEGDYITPFNIIFYPAGQSGIEHPLIDFWSYDGSSIDKLAIYEEDVVQLGAEYIPALTKYLELKEDDSGYYTTDTTVSELINWHEQGLTIVARIENTATASCKYLSLIYFYNFGTLVRIEFGRVVEAQKIEYLSLSNLQTGDLEKLSGYLRIRSTQSDWEAPNNTDGHVLNRTHYSEIRTIVLLPQHTCNITDETGITLRSANLKNLKNYNSVTVIFDNQQYECPVTATADGLYYEIGNIDGSMDYPFHLKAHISAQKHLLIASIGEHTINVTAEELYIKKLEDKFMPTSVPVIQSASVGQTIVVKAVDDNGMPTEWEAVDRTHSSEMITIFEEATVTATNEVGYSIPGLGTIKYGHKYRVTFNDVVYNLTGKLYNGFDTYIGNISILTGDGEDTGEPFAIGSGPNFGGAVFEWTIGAKISGGIKIKVEEEVVNKLPQKYSDTTYVIEITAFDEDCHINKTCESLFGELHDAIIHNKIIVAKITDISYDSNYNYNCNVSYLPCSHFNQVDDSGGIISFACITGFGSSASYKNLIIAYTSPTNAPNLIINKYKIALTI